MRRVIAPAFLALFLFAGSSADAGFGLFHRGADNGCDSGCVVEPVCGCESVDPCCEPAPRCGGLLHKLFHHKNNSCDAGCGCAVEPACGCEVAPIDCGCTVAAPVCGCEAVEPCCGSNHKRGGFFHKLLHHRKGGCDAGCGCEIEPSCGYEIEPSCGCGF